MCTNKTFSTLSTTEETHISTIEDNNLNDDVIDVEFGDPRLIGDLFDNVVEHALNHMQRDEFVDWIANQLRFYETQVEAASRFIETADALRNKLDDVCRLIPESLYPILNHSTEN